MALRDLERYRGDTYPIRVEVKEDGEPLDIAGSTFKLTVHDKRNPVAEPAEFELTGVIVPPSSDGVVEFSPTALQADGTPDTYYYDVEMTTSGGAILTLGKAKYTVIQDVTK